jgi:acyl-CoA synthetase (AMP-forming)/AMP-acid ligase II
VRTYGMTETASQVAATPLEDAARGSEAAARPLPGVELRVAPGGELLVRGPMVARDSLDRDGWLHTGDRGRVEAGELRVEGRVGDVIVTGGENVAAREVEEALLSHAGIADAAVAGEPDPEWGEAVTAYVVPAGARPPEPAALIRHCRERLAPFKVPKAVHLVPELPRNAAGKLQRDRLAALL